MFQILFIICASLQTAHGQAHPFEAALRSLSRTALELDEARTRAADDETTSRAISDLKDRASDLWSDTMLLPVRITDKQFHDLGFDITPLNSTQMTLKQNSNLPKSLALAKAMDVNIWQRAKAAVALQTEVVPPEPSSIFDTDYANGIGEGARRKVLQVIGTDRLFALKWIGQYTNKILGCAAYFKDSYPKFGLQPEEGPQGIKWSESELTRVYGSANPTAFRPDQASAFKANVTDLAKHLHKYQFACVPDDVAIFISEQWAKVVQK